MSAARMPDTSGAITSEFTEAARALGRAAEGLNEATDAVSPAYSLIEAHLARVGVGASVGVPVCTLEVTGPADSERITDLWMVYTRIGGPRYRIGFQERVTDAVRTKDPIAWDAAPRAWKLEGIPLLPKLILKMRDAALDLQAKAAKAAAALADAKPLLDEIEAEIGPIPKPLKYIPLPPDIEAHKKEADPATRPVSAGQVNRDALHAIFERKAKEEAEAARRGLLSHLQKEGAKDAAFRKQQQEQEAARQEAQRGEQERIAESNRRLVEALNAPPPPITDYRRQVK